MIESKGVSSFENVIPVDFKKNPVPELKEILKDKDVAAFYRHVDRYDLREKAIALLSQQIEKLS